MKNLSIYMKFALLCFLFALWSSTSISEERVLEAEVNALRYMVAFFSLDMEGVMATTHPDTIDKAYEAFFTELNRAKESGDSNQFLLGMGIASSPEDLKEKSKRDLYSLMIESNNKRAPKAALEQMKLTNFEIRGSKLINDRTAIVSLAMGIPEPTQVIRLKVVLENEKWLVLGNAQ